MDRDGVAPGRPGIPSDHLKLQPAAPGEPHFGHEPQPSRRDTLLHQPAVEHIPGDKAVGIAASPSHPRAADEPVEPAPQLPQPLVPIPAVPATDPLDGGKGPLGRDIHRGMAMIDEPRALEAAAVATRQLLGIGDVGPASPLERGILACHRIVDRHLERPRADGKIVGGRGVGDDGRVFQAVDQLPADLRIARRDQRQPETRQPGGQHRHRNEEPAEPTLTGVLPHDVAIRHPVRSADPVDF